MGLAAVVVMAPFQVMPPLSDEEYAALRAEIAERGVLVPVLVDQHGRVLDGHHRQSIAAELGIDCPTEVREVDDDEEARDIALTLNLARRHLSREQKRALIGAEIERDPAATDRSIARRLRCSPSTVGAVRREVSKLDTLQPVTDRERRWAEELTEQIRDNLNKGDRGILVGLLRGVPPSMLVSMLTQVMRQLEKEHHGDEELLRPFREVIYGPRIDAILAWPHSGFYADDAASVDDELRELLMAQRLGGVQ